VSRFRSTRKGPRLAFPEAVDVTVPGKYRITENRFPRYQNFILGQKQALAYTSAFVASCSGLASLLISGLPCSLLLHLAATALSPDCDRPGMIIHASVPGGTWNTRLGIGPYVQALWNGFRFRSDEQNNVRPGNIFFPKANTAAGHSLGIGQAH
jgi:hypothetical protein